MFINIGLQLYIMVSLPLTRLKKETRTRINELFRKHVAGSLGDKFVKVASWDFKINCLLDLLEKKICEKED